MMLNIIRELVPPGMLHRDAVADQFNAGPPPERIRDADSLKTKFKNLKNTRKPMGDPSCPSPVRDAKRIARLMENLKM